MAGSSNTGVNSGAPPQSSPQVTTSVTVVLPGNASAAPATLNVIPPADAHKTQEKRPTYAPPDPCDVVAEENVAATLAEMSVRQLRDLAAQKGVPSEVIEVARDSDNTKEQLVALIEQVSADRPGKRLDA